MQQNNLNQFEIPFAKEYWSDFVELENHKNQQNAQQKANIEQPISDVINELNSYKHYFQSQQIQFALGAMFGAFQGDALGSHIQFKKNISQQTLDKAMTMPGAGTFEVLPGQFTDDSQMAAHLLKALSQFNPSQQFEQQKTKILYNIGSQYLNWRQSNPFDIGFTTQSALMIISSTQFQAKIVKQTENKEINYQKVLKQIWSQINNQSQSNGSLMRITPMAFFISLMIDLNQQTDFQNYKSFIKGQINLTHRSPAILESSLAWVQLLTQLIRRKKTKKTLILILTQFLQKYLKIPQITQWISQCKSLKLSNARQLIGWSRIAFTTGIIKLTQLIQKSQQSFDQNDFIKIMKQVLKMEGDTDTNADIVGGLIGATIGWGKLPKFYLGKQFALRLTSNNKYCQFRDTFYQPRRQFLTAMRFIHKIKSYQNTNKQ